MPRPKPILGYPSKTDAVLALRSQGKSSREIADLIGTVPSRLSTFTYGVSRRTKPRKLVIGERTFERLQAQAEVHGMAPLELAEQILMAATRKGMVGDLLSTGDAR